MQWLPNIWSLIRGNDEQIVVHLLDIDKTPLNISGASGVILKVPMSDGSVLRKVAATGFAYGMLRPIYIYGFSFTATETAAMLAKPNQTVEVEIDFGGAVKTFPIPSSLSVTDKVYQ